MDNRRDNSSDVSAARQLGPPRWDFRIYTPEELMPSGLTQKEQEFIKECLREKGWLW